MGGAGRRRAGSFHTSASDDPGCGERPVALPPTAALKPRRFGNNPTAHDGAHAICLMESLVMLPFLVGGVLLIVYRDRILETLRGGDPTLYTSVLGEDRVRRLEGRPESFWQRFDDWGPSFLLVFGIFWVLISLYVLARGLFGLG